MNDNTLLAVDVRNAVKRYGDFVALQKISLGIRDNEFGADPDNAKKVLSWATCGRVVEVSINRAAWSSILSLEPRLELRPACVG